MKHRHILKKIEDYELVKHYSYGDPSETFLIEKYACLLFPCTKQYEVTLDPITRKPVLEDNLDINKSI